jgi:hypothetical protein
VNRDPNAPQPALRLRAAWPRRWALAVAVALAPACGDKELDASGDTDDGGEAGAACDPAAGPDADGCAEGYVCEALSDGSGSVCGAPIEIRGSVVDALSLAPIEGARVTALDETGAPAGPVAVTDAEGRYELGVRALRAPDGSALGSSRWTLFVVAAAYEPFPSGVRPALPIDASTATEGEGDVAPAVIDNPSTVVGLLPRPAGAAGVTIAGTVLGEAPSGTLVAVEAASAAPAYAIADVDGSYVLFDVPPGDYVVRGYKRGLELEPATVSVAANDLSGVDLRAIAEGVDALATVSGSISIVNAPGGAATSVVLVPSPLFRPELERGPVPFGLRAPEPPSPVAIGGAFAIAGVPAGTYRVLAAFENDGLVRDPDTGIAGTAIPEITVVAATDLAIDEGFKVTAALDVVSPGAEIPEAVSGTPTFVFADDSSEDGYELLVFDAFGGEVWRTEIAGVTGSSTVEVPYGGPPLASGQYYQFRATSFRERQGGQTPISRTEDLKGVFIAAP